MDKFRIICCSSVALGLSIWAFAKPCKKDGFGNTMTYSDFLQLLNPPVGAGGTPWAIDRLYLLKTPFPGTIQPCPLPQDAKNPLSDNCQLAGCTYNSKFISEESFNKLSSLVKKLTKENRAVVIPTSYKDLSDWKIVYPAVTPGPC